MVVICEHCRKQEAIGECGTHKTSICDDCSDGECRVCMNHTCNIFIGTCGSCRTCSSMGCGGIGEFTCVSRLCKGMYVTCRNCAGESQSCGRCGSHLVGRCAESECNELSTIRCTNKFCDWSVCQEHFENMCPVCNSELEGMCSSKGCDNRGRLTENKEFLCEKCHAETQTWNMANIAQCQYCGETMLASLFYDPDNLPYCKQCAEYCKNLAQNFNPQGL